MIYIIRYFPSYFNEAQNFTDKEVDYIKQVIENNKQTNTIRSINDMSRLLRFFIKWTRIYVNNSNQIIEPITISVLAHILYHWPPWKTNLPKFMLGGETLRFNFKIIIFIH